MFPRCRRGLSKKTPVLDQTRVDRVPRKDHRTRPVTPDTRLTLTRERENRKRGTSPQTVADGSRLVPPPPPDSWVVHAVGVYSRVHGERRLSLPPSSLTHLPTLDPIVYTANSDQFPLTTTSFSDSGPSRVFDPPTTRTVPGEVWKPEKENIPSPLSVWS